MKRILITGATGNVGETVLDSLQAMPDVGPILAGVRDVTKDQARWHKYPRVTPVRFDFADESSFGPALRGVEGVFLLLPPGLSKAEERFRQLAAAAREAGVRHLVFMAVQGVENNSFLPHHKIEKQLAASGVPYTFLRPAYFMQNFNTTLRDDVVGRSQIYLPAGNARFVLIDVRDIGRVAAEVLRHPEAHANQAYALTAATPMTFGEMSAALTQGLGRPIRYLSPNPLRFFLTKKSQGVPVTFIMIMIMLHYLPRFQEQPPTTDWVQRITGHAPHSFAEYVHDYKKQLS